MNLDALRGQFGRKGRWVRTILIPAIDRLIGNVEDRNDDAAALEGRAGGGV